MGYGKSGDDAMRGAKTGGSDFWNPSDGETRIRVMPPATEDQDDFWFKTATHFNVGPDERAVPCPSESGIRDSCFLCRLGKRLGRGDEDEQAEAEDIGARPRFLISIVDYADPEEGVQVWPCPVTVFRQLKKFRLNEDEYGDMTDLKEGYDIIVERAGSGINTKYDATPARKNSAFPTKELLDHRVEAVAELFQALKDEEFELPVLAEAQTFLEDDEMERVYKGVSGGRTRTESSTHTPDEDDDDDDGDEEVEEPNDEAEEVAEGDEAEEKPPKRERRSERKSDDKGKSDGKSGRSRLRGRVRDLS